MTAPDGSKWVLPAAGPGTDLNGTIDPANLNVVGGNLEISGSGTVGAQIIAATGQTYGAWEIRALLPVGVGYGPDFDLFPVSGLSTDGEINIFNATDGTGANAKQSLKRLSSSTYAWNNTASITAGAFHLYRIEWTPTRVTLYIDGVKSWEVLSTSTWGLPAVADTYSDTYFANYGSPASGESGANYIPTVPMKLRMLLNVGVTARTDGSPPTLGIPVRNGSTPQPFKMLVDYVRVYDYVPSSTGSGTANIPFDFVNYGTGATALYDGLHAKVGTRSAKLSTGSTSSTIAMGYDVSLGTQGTIYGRCYWYFNARTPQHRIVSMSNASGVCAFIQITATGVVQLCQFDGTVRGSSSTSVPLNQWIRLEWNIIATTNGVSELRIFYSPDSSVADQIISINGNWRGSITTYSIGVGTATANVGPYWVDSIGWDTAGWLGADGPNNPPTVTMPATFKSLYGKIATIGPSSAFDPDGAGVSFAWAMTSAPSGAASFDNTQTTQNIIYAPTKVGNYTFQLAVQDPSGLTTNATTTLTVKPIQWQNVAGVAVPMKKHVLGPTTWTVPAGYTEVERDDFTTNYLSTRWSLYGDPGAPWDANGDGFWAKEAVDIATVNNKPQLRLTGTKDPTTSKPIGGVAIWLGNSGAAVHLGGRWEYDVSYDAGQGYGGVVLLWPNSDANWPINGEMDLPKFSVNRSGNTRNAEDDFILSTVVDDSAHRLTYSPIGGSSTPIDWTQRRACALEWVPGQYIRHFVDGVLVAQTTNTSYIPSTLPMGLIFKQDFAGQSTATNEAGPVVMRVYRVRFLTIN